MFLLRSDGGVWFFRPHDRRATAYGRVRNETLERSDDGARGAQGRGTHDGAPAGFVWRHAAGERPCH
jgi:hypothetical protein